MEAPSTSLRLRSISICGIGSYLHGAELQIRPLTLLCGKNGSGKSTWFKVIELLKASCGYDNRLPFRLADRTSLTNIDQLQNFTIRQSSDWEGIPNNVLKKYGPPGTITVTAQALDDFQCTNCIDEEQSESWDVRDRLFWAGHCSAGSTIVMRLSLQTSAANNKTNRIISLSIDKRPLFSFEQSPDDKHFACFIYPLDSEAAVGSTMEHFADAFVSDSAALTVTPHSDYPLDGSNVHQLIEMAGNLLSGLLSKCMASFHIGAIREPGHKASDPISRYVGHRGEYSFDLLGKYALNKMFQHEPPFSGYLHDGYTTRRPPKSEFWNWREQLFSKKANPLKIVLKCATKEEQQAIRAWVQADNELNDSIYELLMTVALRALGSQDLYKKHKWNNLTPEIENLLQIESSNLHEQDLRRLNLHLIEQALTPLIQVNDTCTYIFDTYVGAWLKRLLDITPGMDPLDNDDSHAERYWMRNSPLPRGYLNSHKPQPENLDFGYDFTTNEERFDHPCVPKATGCGWKMNASHFSSGFHQVFPMIVQAGLMKKNEILCIENPEVHLHPSLQANVADFLIGEAASGKYMILETHSDMLVIKTLKSILKGILNQEQIRIYFTSLKARDEATSAYYSTLEQVRVNKYGRVANWPTGFMDTEVTEMAEIDELLEWDGDEEAEQA